MTPVSVTAWRFVLGRQPGPVELHMPRGAEVVGVGKNPLSDEVAIWVAVDPRAPRELRGLFLAYTGDPVPEMMRHAGMTVIGTLVFHVWIQPA